MILKVLFINKATYPIKEPLVKSSATATHVEVVMIREHRTIEKVTSLDLHIIIFIIITKMIEHLLNARYIGILM